MQQLVCISPQKILQFFVLLLCQDLVIWLQPIPWREKKKEKTERSYSRENMATKSSFIILNYYNFKLLNYAFVNSDTSGIAKIVTKLSKNLLCVYKSKFNITHKILLYTMASNSSGHFGYLPKISVFHTTNHKSIL